jgi:putative copper resistance protein D
VLDPLIVIRSVHFAASVLAAGTVAFVVLVAEPAASAANGSPAGFAALRQRWNWLIWIALAVAMLSGALWLVLLAAAILNAPVADVWLNGGIWSVLTDTRFGQVWSARAALAVLLAALLTWPSTRWLQLAAAAALIALPAFIGHAGATPGTAGDIHLASDIVHLLAAGAWLGGLPALAMILAHARRAPELAWREVAIRATVRFSRLGIIGVGALLASGIVNSWNLLSGPGDLLSTDYGRLLLLKIGLFVAMVGIAAVNKFRLTPRLAAIDAMRSLQRNSLIETGLGVCVLAVVGALGTMAPSAHQHAAPAEVPPDAAFVHIHSTEAMAEVTIDPGRAGRTHVAIRILREDISEFPAKSVRLAFDSPAPASTTVERLAVRAPDGIWQIDAIDLPEPGVWTVRVIITPVLGRPILLDSPIVINR